MDLTPQTTLLFIDDDPIYAEFLISSLAKAGLPFSIRHLSSLDQALAYVRGDEPYKDRSLHPIPAVVLLDINLSARSGFPVLSWLRDNGCLENEKVRVVMLTSSDRSADIQQALKLGALSYLVKSPFPGSLIQLLR
jgi:CheY-like chemotaxis protein